MGLFSNLLPVAGAAAGGFFGGPAGAMLGGQLGGAFGGAMNQHSEQKQIRQNQEQAQQYLNQIPGIGHQYYDPYVNQGLEAGNQANEAYGGMLQDPSGFVNKILAGYKPSEGYQFQKEELGKSLGNTAAAGGFAGTEYDEGVRGKLLQSLLSGDMQQYLTNVLGVHGQGLAGKEGIAGRGFNASGALADYLGTNLTNQADVNLYGGRQRLNSMSNYNNQGLGAGINAAGNMWGNQPGKIWDGRYQSNVPGAAFGR